MKNAVQKLSKRNGDETFEDLLNMGYLPEAVVNYIALLGWSPKGEREIFSLKELQDVFDISGICKSPAIFDIKKLTAINSKHIRQMDDDVFLKNAKPYLDRAYKRKLDEKFLAKMLKERTEKFADLIDQLDFIDSTGEYDVELFVSKKMKSTKETSLNALEEILAVLKDCEDFSYDNIHKILFNLIEKLGVKNGVLLWPLRVSLSGRQFTPGGGTELCVLLGKNESILRIEKGIELLKANV